MKQTKWFQDAIIYQIYPRSFCDSNGDGIGDIPGIISKIPYLKSLGINTIWLSPVYPSPMDDNGYDIANYTDIHPMFGNLKDFQEMVEKLHQNGIRLIMDLVMNHTSDEHPWFIASKDPNSPYRDYYFWRKGKGKNPPNNWTGFFGKPCWEYDSQSDAYYLHLFGTKQPDVNWDNPKVREEFKNIIRFWCDLGVDGFRLDVINVISKQEGLPNGKEKLILKGSKYFINGPHLHEYLQEIYRDAFSHYDLLTVGETVFTNLDDAKLLTKEERNELSMIFNFDHTSVDNYMGVKWLMRPFSLRRYKKILGKYQKGLQEEGWNSLFYENHDQRRSVGRFHTNDGDLRKESAKMLAVSMYFLKGTPFIYQGQEIGMTNSDIQKIEDYVDIETKDVNETAKKLLIPKWYRQKMIRNGSRDNARTPMQWNQSPNAGFTTGTPWLKVNDNYRSISVEESLQDENSIFHFYQKLLQLRSQEDLVKHGQYIDLFPRSKWLYGYLRKGEKESLLILCSYSKKAHRLPRKIKYDGEVLLNSYLSFDQKNLFPYQAVVLKIKSK